ncbi:MAG: MoaD/ThiS family protein [Frankiaceae bacterium]
MTGQVVVRFWAAAREAAGCGEENVPAGPLPVVLANAVERHPGLGPVLPVCSVLVDGQRVGRDDPEAVVAPGAVVEVLPPFAGG